MHGANPRVPWRGLVWCAVATATGIAVCVALLLFSLIRPGLDPYQSPLLLFLFPLAVVAPAMTVVSVVLHSGYDRNRRQGRLLAAAVMGRWLAYLLYLFVVLDGIWPNVAALAGWLDGFLGLGDAEWDRGYLLVFGLWLCLADAVVYPLVGGLVLRVPLSTYWRAMCLVWVAVSAAVAWVVVLAFSPSVKASSFGVVCLLMGTHALWSGLPGLVREALGGRSPE